MSIHTKWDATRRPEEEWRIAIPELATLGDFTEHNDWHNDTPLAQSERLLAWVLALPDSLLPGSFYARLGGDLAAWLEAPAAGGYSRRALLAFVALLHDIGKSATPVRAPDGETPCPGHEQVGAGIVTRIIRRFDFTPAEQALIVSLVQYHGEPYTLLKQLAPNDEAPPAARLRAWAAPHRDYLDLLLLLAQGDMETSHLREIRPEKYARVSTFYTNLAGQLWSGAPPAMPALDAGSVAQAIHENHIPSFGLTLVIGRPLPEPLLDWVDGCRRSLEASFPKLFHWRARSAIHASLVAPRRGVYRPAPPLSRSELSSEFENYLQALARFSQSCRSLELMAAPPLLSRDGALIVPLRHGRELRAALTDLQAQFGLGAPKHSGELAFTWGYLAASELVTNAAGLQAVQAALAALPSLEESCWLVDELKLVHYAERTLAQVLGEVTYRLGALQPLSPDQVLAALHLFNSGPVS